MHKRERTVFPLHDGYVWEKLFDGLTCLAEGSGSPPERLAYAYDSHLRRLETTVPEDLSIPLALSREIQGILNRIRSNVVIDGDRHWEMVGADEATIGELISGLVLVYGKVCCLLTTDHVAVQPKEELDGE